MAQHSEPRIRTRLVALLVGLALAVPIGWRLGWWTYLAYGARHGSHTPAVAVVEDSWTRGGISTGSGQDHGPPTSFTETSVRLRVLGQDRSQVFDPLPAGVSIQTTDGRLPVTTWRGHVIDINGERAQAGWQSAPRFGAALAMYPLLLAGALLALTQSVQLGRRLISGPALRYERGTSGGPWLLGVAAGFALAFTLAGVAVFVDPGWPWWPAVPLPAALLLCAWRLVRHLRRRYPTVPTTL